VNARGDPARLKPRGLLGREDQPVDRSVTRRVRAGPAGGAAAELASRVARWHVKIHGSPYRFSK
jgi:hypothetical protein